MYMQHFLSRCYEIDFYCEATPHLVGYFVNVSSGASQPTRWSYSYLIEEAEATSETRTLMYAHKTLAQGQNMALWKNRC